MLALTAAGLIARTASSRRKVTPDGQLRLHSVRGAREILRAARQFFGEGGWTLEDRSSGWLAFSYELRPSLVVLVLLVLLGIIPGLVYFALARRTLKLVIESASDGAGSATRLSWNNNLACEDACKNFAWMIREQEPDRSRGRRRRVVRPRKRHGRLPREREHNLDNPT